MKGFQSIKFFPDAAKFYGLSGYGAHGESSATAGVTVHFAENDSGEFQCLVESFGHLNRILAGHGISHQEYLAGVELRFELLQLTHQFGVNMKTTGSVHNEDVAALLSRITQSRDGNLHRVHFSGGREYRHPELFSESLELIDGRRAIHVGRHQTGFTVEVFEMEGEFSCCSGLSRALKTDQHVHEWGTTGEFQGRSLTTHEFCQGLVNNLDHLLARGKALHNLFASGLLAKVGDKLFCHLIVHVSF